jgi:hypothetical protein
LELPHPIKPVVWNSSDLSFFARPSFQSDAIKIVSTFGFFGLVIITVVPLVSTSKRVNLYSRKRTGFRANREAVTGFLHALLRTVRAWDELLVPDLVETLVLAEGRRLDDDTIFLPLSVVSGYFTMIQSDA